MKIDLRELDKIIQERFRNNDLITFEELIRDYEEALYELKDLKEGE